MIVNNDVRKCVLMKESIELLKSLTDVNGIAGYERNVKAKMKEYLEPVSDEIIEDGLVWVAYLVKKQVTMEQNHLW